MDFDRCGQIVAQQMFGGVDEDTDIDVFGDIGDAVVAEIFGDYGGEGPATKKIIERFLLLMCKLHPDECQEYRITYEKPSGKGIIDEMVFIFNSQIRQISGRASRALKRPVSPKEIIADLYLPKSQIVGVV